MLWNTWVGGSGNDHRSSRSPAFLFVFVFSPPGPPPDKDEPHASSPPLPLPAATASWRMCCTTVSLGGGDCRRKWGHIT